jgi:hypothetical protein
MEIFYRKRKKPIEDDYSKYEVYRNFCFVETVSQEDIIHATDIIVRGARFLRAKIDWGFFWARITENHDPILKVPSHDFLIGIAEMLQLLMLHDPSLFDFCIFSDMPDLVMARIVECLAEIGGTMECRTLCKKWCSFATNEKIFPKLSYRDLALVSWEQWHFLFLLCLLDEAIPDGSWLFFDDVRLERMQPVFSFERRQDSFCFPGYPEEVHVLHFFGLRNAYEKMGPIVAHMNCEFASNAPLHDRYDLVKAYGGGSKRDCADRNMFIKKMERPEFRKYLFRLYLREIKGMKI